MAQPPAKLKLKLKLRPATPLTVFEGFAGYGGASFALKRLGIPFETIGYSEIDPGAIQIYEMNHPNVPNFGDITQIQPERLPDFDLFTGGFPCQPFSSAGANRGELDTRGTLFHDIIRILQVKKPKMVLLENVKGILAKRHQATFDRVVADLKGLHYHVTWKLLDSNSYGNAQHRERVWIFATLGGGGPVDFTPPGVRPPGHVKDYLDATPDRELYLSAVQIDRLVEIHKVDFNVPQPCCLDVYNKKIKLNGICPTITEPHHNTLRIVEPMRGGKFIVRKMSPTEHFRLMGFKEGEIKIDNMSYAQLCKRAGNGWDIGVVELIMRQLPL
jgi:DNA (cytosine-5)-methyltransferase 1